MYAAVAQMSGQSRRGNAAVLGSTTNRGISSCTAASTDSGSPAL